MTEVKRCEAVAPRGRDFKGDQCGLHAGHDGPHTALIDSRFIAPDCSQDRRPSASEVMQDDLLEMLRALGLGDHARPDSPHFVVQDEILPAIRRLVAAAALPAPNGDQK
jgi:hypothetical protein